MSTKLSIRKEEITAGIKPADCCTELQIKVQMTAGPKGSPVAGECQDERKTTRAS